jgi:hypothetical protein
MMVVTENYVYKWFNENKIINQSTSSAINLIAGNTLKYRFKKNVVLRQN